MKTKASHSLILLLAAAPFALAQFPAAIPGSTTDPTSAPTALAGTPGGADALPPPADSAIEGPVAGPPAAGSADNAPTTPAALPVADPSVVPGLDRDDRNTASGSPPAPTPVPGLTPPLPPTPARRPLPPVPPPVEQPSPVPVAEGPPNVYSKHYKNPPVAAGAPEKGAGPESVEGAGRDGYTRGEVKIFDRSFPGGAYTLRGWPEPEPMTATVNYATAPRGEQVVRDIKFKVLQRHYESTFSEAVEAEKAAIFASGGEKEALSARAKALQDFAAKLEADIRALPEAVIATHAQNKMDGYGSSSGEGDVSSPRATIVGGGVRLTAPAPARKVHVEALPPDSNRRGPAPGESRSRMPSP